jgi:NodT family efflux transporter outer membrane factor (OMF) lipoprotein
MRASLRTALAACTLPLVLAGCTVGADYHRPQVKAPPAWHAQSTAVASVTVGGEVDERWWASFNDAELTSLVGRMMRQNLDLASAAERIQQARAQRTVTHSAGQPQVGAQAQYARERLSPSGVLSLVQPAPGAPLEVDSWSQSLAASWEVDMFGKVRRAVEAADANTAVVIEARHAVALDALADLAGDYMDLRGVQAREAIARDNLATARQTLVIVKDRFANGLGTTLDVARAQGQVEAIAATLPLLHTRRVQLIDAMGTLLAAQPRELEAELTPVAALPAVPLAPRVGLPGDLLRRRPDIREAEAALHAATAETGVATAAFYPDISLTGQFGTDGLHLRNLWSAANRAFSVGPTISLPFFQGGRLKGTLALRKAQQREAAILYQKSVIQALNDADSALTAFADIQQRRDSLSAEVEQDRMALSAARDNYREGAIGLLSVTTAQATLLEGQDRLAQSEAGVRQMLVLVYKALGGGWHAADAPA